VRWYGRLRRSGEIAFVRRRGRRLGFETCSVFALDDPGPTRVCVTVAKAVGGAVVRNAVRRRIRGALDAQPLPAKASRLVFVAKPAAATASFSRICGDVAAALGQAPGRPR